MIFDLILYTDSIQFDVYYCQYTVYIQKIKNELKFKVLTFNILANIQKY